MKNNFGEGLRDIPSVFALGVVWSLIWLLLAHYAARIILWPLYKAGNAWMMGESIAAHGWVEVFLRIELPSLTNWFRYWGLFDIPLAIGIGALPVLAERSTKIKERILLIGAWLAIIANIVIFSIDIILDVPESLLNLALRLWAVIRDVTWTVIGAILAIKTFDPVKNYLGRWFD